MPRPISVESLGGPFAVAVEGEILIVDTAISDEEAITVEHIISDDIGIVDGGDNST